MGVLGLGIAVMAGVGTLAWQNLFAPLPFHDAARLVQIYHNADLTSGISLEEVAFYERESRALESLAGWRAGEATFASRGGGARRVVKATVTPNMFGLLGARFSMGRGFAGDVPERSAVLSHRFWRLQLGEDPDIIGSTVDLDGERHLVLGVLSPRAYIGTEEVDLYVPLISVGASLGDTYVDVLARLAPGATRVEASAEVDAATRLLPNVGGGGPNSGRPGGYVLALRDAWHGERTPLVMAALAASALLLAATLLNALMLVWLRMLRRREEFRIRAALGATEREVRRGLLTESVVLGGMAALLGLLGAQAVLVGLPWLLPGLGSALAGRISLPLILFVVLASCVAVGLQTVGGRRLQESVTERLLVPAQVALAVVLVSGSIMLFQTVGSMLGVDLGYRTEGVVTARVSLAGSEYDDADGQRRYFGELLEAVGSQGISSVGIVSSLPLTEYRGGGDVFIQTVDPDSAVDVISQRLVTPGYFSAMDIPLLAGRMFDPHDRDGAPRVAIVDELFAQTHFGSARGALGASLRFFMGGEEWNEVVGVVGTVRPDGPRGDRPPVVYVHFDQRPSRAGHVVAATDGSGQSRRDILAAAAAVDPRVPLYDVGSMDERLAAAMAPERIALRLFAVCGGLAILLAAMGSYAVTLLTIERRRREMDIRRALGAPVGRMVGVAARNSGQPLVLGLLAGALGSLTAGRAIEALLFGVAAADPVSIALAGGVVASAVLVAAIPSVLRVLRARAWTGLRGP